jgi:hypothetical protein
MIGHYSFRSIWSHSLDGQSKEIRWFTSQSATPDPFHGRRLKIGHHSDPDEPSSEIVANS